MRKLFVAAIGLFILSMPQNSRGQEKKNFFPLKDVKPGMRICGKTVYRGAKPSLFCGRVIGKTHLTSEPGRMMPKNLIIAKIGDPSPGQFAGISRIFAGMSGSPVYDRDPFKDKRARLLGAVSIRYGHEPVESIAGITPIEEMYEEVTGPEETSGAYASPAHPVEAVFLNGVEPGLALAFLRKMEEKTGAEYVLFSASSEDETTAPASTPNPGGMVGIQMISGDIDFGYGCTITYVDKTKGTLLACGHEINGLGSVSYGMRRADVLYSMNDRSSPTKIIKTYGKPFGAFYIDRFSGIVGKIGAKPKVIPITIKVRNGKEEKTVGADVAQYAASTDLLTLVLLQGLVKSSDISKVGLMEIKGKVIVSGSGADGKTSVRTLTVDQIDSLPSVLEGFSGTEAVPKEDIVYKKAQDIIKNVFSGLLTAPQEMNIEFKSVELDVNLLGIQGGFSAETLQVRDKDGNLFDADFFSSAKLKVARGDEVNVTVVVKDLYGPDNYEKTVTVKIPEDSPLGPGRISIGDGHNLSEWWDKDASRSTDKMYRRGFGGLIDYLAADQLSNKVIYVRLELPPAPIGQKTAGGDEDLNGWKKTLVEEANGKIIDYRFPELPFPAVVPDAGLIQTVSLEITAKPGKK